MVPDLSWWPDWKGQTLVIVASGPSAKDVPIDFARDRAKVIVINNSWRLAPWADMLFACDHKWWLMTKGWKYFGGLKVTIDKTAAHRYGLNYVHCLKGDDRIQFEPKGTVGWAGNSGFHCLNLALQMEVAKVVLVGYDMRIDRGLHWHGSHPAGMANPREGSVGRWRRCVDAAEPHFRKAGIPVINCSPASSLVAYPKMGFEEALGC